MFNRPKHLFTSYGLNDMQRYDKLTTGFRSWHGNLLVQLDRRGERTHWPLLSQTKLSCNSMRHVVLNSIEAYERARHRIYIFVGEAHVAELNLRFF